MYKNKSDITSTAVIIGIIIVFAVFVIFSVITLLTSSSKITDILSFVYKATSGKPLQQQNSYQNINENALLASIDLL